MGDADGGGNWLLSLGAESNEPANVEEDVDWLSSLTGSSAKAAQPIAVSVDVSKSEKKVSDAVLAYVGKPLPIPPFWRTAPKEQLDKQLQRERPLLLERMRRMAKDARRTAQRLGRLRG